MPKKKSNINYRNTCEYKVRSLLDRIVQRIFQRLFKISTEHEFKKTQLLRLKRRDEIGYQDRFGINRNLIIIYKLIKKFFDVDRSNSNYYVFC